MLELDSHKLYWHPELVRAFAAGQIDPITIEIGPTAACNHDCTFCAFEYRKDPDRLPFEVIERVFDLSVSPISIHLAGDGEPTLYPGFYDLVKKFAQRKISLGVTTNGARAEKLFQAAPYLTWCRFSINA
jgi:MoaA/NifB/PqqE/SkfB family radical SAM enzyme